MSIRVATWNMNHRGTNAEGRAAAWDHLERELKPDVALVQEAVSPKGIGAGVVYREGGIGGRRAWGSAVVSFGPEFEAITSHGNRTTGYKELNLLNTHPGCVAIAEVRPPDVEPLVAVSVYGVFDYNYVITNLHRVLSDLTPLLDSPLGRRVILGGDLNCSTQVDPPYREWHRNLFERIRLLGLVDLLEQTASERPPLEDCWCDDEPCRHLQTH